MTTVMFYYAAMVYSLQQADLIGAAQNWFADNVALGLFMIAAILDIVTGVYSAAVQGRLSSEIAFNKLLRKLGVFFLPPVALVIERALATLGQAYPIVTITCFLLVVLELTSILENLEKGGVPVGFMRGWLKQVSDRIQAATTAPGMMQPNTVVVKQTIELPGTATNAETAIQVDKPTIVRMGTGELKPQPDFDKRL